MIKITEKMPPKGVEVNVKTIYDKLNYRPWPAIWDGDNWVNGIGTFLGVRLEVTEWEEIKN